MTDEARERASRDYGGLITRLPSTVDAPSSVDELAARVRELRAAKLPWVVRGAGHSSGGQPLIQGGAVIETSRLAAVVRDEDTTITVEGGARWLEVVRHLARDGRRPAVVTDQLRTTVGGTLSVGGVGETSHVDGLQIDHVRALTLVTPDGAIHRLRENDELFRFALAGSGQLGVIAEATIATRRRASTVAVRALAYSSVAEGLAAIEALPAAYPFVRARIRWRDGTYVKAVIGAFSSEIDAAPPPTLGDARKASEPEIVDLVADRGREERVRMFAPCAEIVLPRRAAAAIWEKLDVHVRAFGLPAYMPDGASIVIVAPGTLPLAPSAVGADGGVVIALRPRTHDEAIARRIAAWLRELSARALALGARIYPIGEEPDDVRWARTQYASVWDAWSTLKDRLDPDRLCHPWRL